MKMQNTDIETVVRDCIATLIMNVPLLGLFLKRTWIYESKNIAFPASTNGLAIYINPKYFLLYSPAERVYILAHEAMHIILKHNLRRVYFRHELADKLPPEIVQAVLNVAADAKANQYLDEIPELTKPTDRITIHLLAEILDISPYNTLHMSYEELTILILKKLFENMCENCKNTLLQGQKQNKPDTLQTTEKTNKKHSKCPLCKNKIKPPWYDLESEQPTKDRILNQGDPADQNTLTPEQIERRIERKLTEVTMILKTIGKLPGWAERLIDEILEPLIDWRTVLKARLTLGFGIKIRKIWTRPNKKLPNLLPGKDTRGLQKVSVLIDTSGSISTPELKQFLGEVYGILKEVAKVTVIPWDATAYEPIILRNKGDIEKIKTKGLKGGGGTVILPALQLTEKTGKDLVIILSDWRIDDLHKPEVQEWFKKNASITIPVTTETKPPEILKNPIKLRIRKNT
jgi:predicted metal-dependent peptidase